MSKEKVYPVSEETQSRAHIQKEEYEAMYKASIEEPEQFWTKKAEEFISWFQPWETVMEQDFTKGKVGWFVEGKLNASVNCIDRHLKLRGNQTAIIWEGDNPKEEKYISYNELFESVCKLANVLKERGIKKGDRVCIYMPMIPEATFAMLACARIGAIHSVVFGGFSPQALRDRILDSDCRLVVTANEGLRGSKAIPLKENTDQALLECPNVHSVIVVERTSSKVSWKDSRDIWYHQATEKAEKTCDPEIMNAEDPLFILYTSGSTGKPKGVLHSTGGYMLQAAMTHKYVFDYHDRDIFWCTADVGWITGHSYIVYGPLANGATTLMFEGIPTHPNPSRFWKIIDKHKVNVFYTAPTALRSLMSKGNEYLENSSRETLRTLGTVGEPINPEAWEWYHEVVGNSRCPIIDTWWQTETGGIMITPLPGVTALKPGSATLPFFGVKPVLLNSDGNEINGAGSGSLAISGSWPGQIRTVFGDHDRCFATYYSTYKGYYFTGDGARRDEDGYYWITGRVDDVLNVSGHRMGTAEVESALVLHSAVAEAAVVGYPHDIKGQGIYAFVTLMHDVAGSQVLKEQLISLVRSEIGPFAKPDFIQWAPSLPKTRSGKIMRRILRKIAASEIDTLGDTSTLADPSVVRDLIEGRISCQ